jgi:hypothetical protein
MIMYNLYLSCSDTKRIQNREKTETLNISQNGKIDLASLSNERAHSESLPFVCCKALRLNAAISKSKVILL